MVGREASRAAAAEVQDADQLFAAQQCDAGARHHAPGAGVIARRRAWRSGVPHDDTSATHSLERRSHVGVERHRLGRVDPARRTSRWASPSARRLRRSRRARGRRGRAGEARSAVADAISPMSRLAAVRRAIALRSSVSPRRACICSKRSALSIASEADRQTASTVAMHLDREARSRRRSNSSRTPITRSLAISGTLSWLCQGMPVELLDLLGAALGVVPAGQGDRLAAHDRELVRCPDTERRCGALPVEVGDAVAEAGDTVEQVLLEDVDVAAGRHRSTA